MVVWLGGNDLYSHRDQEEGTVVVWLGGNDLYSHRNHGARPFPAGAATAVLRQLLTASQRTGSSCWASCHATVTPAWRAACPAWLRPSWRKQSVGSVDRWSWFATSGVRSPIGTTGSPERVFLSSTAFT